MSSEADVKAAIVNEYLDFFVKDLPVEHAIELNRVAGVEVKGAADG